MYSFALLLFLGPQRASSTAEIDGAWVDSKARPVVIERERIDWEAEGVYYSGAVRAVPDGSMLGGYTAGREILSSLPYSKPSTAAQKVELPGDYPLAPDHRTFGAPYGEVRVTVKTRSGGRAVVLTLDVTPKGKNAASETLFRALPLGSLSVAGTFGDKDVKFHVDDEGGPRSHLKGSLAYLGKTYQMSGLRLRGRASFLLFDPSRNGSCGEGTAVWSPSTDRAIDMRERRSEATDQIAFFFKLNDGSAATRIHKSLKRLP